MAAHEHQCFVQRCQLEPHAVVCHNLLDGVPTLETIRGFDVLMVGGSGDYYVSKRNLPGFDRFLELLQDVAQVGHPTFASCFGYQCLVLALGGEIIHDPPNTEVGTYALELTRDGADDPLFGGLPASFQAQMGHKDRAACHPPGIPNLAQSQRSPFQALKVPKAPVWATQFHPELDRQSNQARYRHYLNGYAVFMAPEERADAMSRFKDSPEASSLLQRFLHLVLD